MTSVKGVWDDASARTVLREIFDAAVASADPARAVLDNLPQRPKGKCVVIGAGKASAAMAAALDEAWRDIELTGVVVTRYGHLVPAGRIEIIEAAHPVPDAMSEEAGHRLLAAVSDLGPDDLVVSLMSGGASSLLVAPAGETLADKQEVNRVLLASGASISEMNIVRKRLSRIKGGKLAAAAYPAKVITLVVSDVPGDDPSEVGSGPTVADISDPRLALEIVQRYGMQLPSSALAVLAGDTTELRMPKTDVRTIASPSMALAAAASVARAHGLQPLILGDALEGEAREIGRVMAGIALSSRQFGLPIRGPAVLLSGGEGTVTLQKSCTGLGGRNTEFLLSLAISLNCAHDIWALAGDTDGIDGVEDAAGAIVTPDTLVRMKAAGVDPKSYLRSHDSFSAFRAVNDLVITGPTLTNVNDLRAILIS